MRQLLRAFDGELFTQVRSFRRLTSSKSKFVSAWSDRANTLCIDLREHPRIESEVEVLRLPRRKVNSGEAVQR